MKIKKQTLESRINRIEEILKEKKIVSDDNERVVEVEDLLSIVRNFISDNIQLD